MTWLYISRSAHFILKNAFPPSKGFQHKYENMSLLPHPLLRNNTVLAFVFLVYCFQCHIVFPFNFVFKIAAFYNWNLLNYHSSWMKLSGNFLKRIFDQTFKREYGDRKFWIKQEKQSVIFCVFIGECIRIVSGSQPSI